MRAAPPKRLWNRWIIWMHSQCNPRFFSHWNNTFEKILQVYQQVSFRDVLFWYIHRIFHEFIITKGAVTSSTSADGRCGSKVTDRLKIVSQSLNSNLCEPICLVLNWRSRDRIGIVLTKISGFWTFVVLLSWKITN